MARVRRFSIRRYLLVTLLAVVTFSMAMTGWQSYRDALHELEELFDAQLAQSARMLLSILTTYPLLMQKEGDTVVFPAWRPESGVDIPAVRGIADQQATAQGHKYETRLVFQLWEGNGERLLMRSSNAPATPLARFAPGYAEARLNGEGFHVFSLWHDGMWLQVAQDTYMRGELASEIAVATLLPHLAGIPLMALLIWLIVSRGLRPLDALRGAIAGRGADNLAPLAGARSVELQPMVVELNRLLARLHDSFERERRFTSDAAHELRTPLAALRIQAENALAATDDGARRHALDNLLRGVDRAGRLVSQLLTLARLEPDAAARAFAPVRLDAVVREELATLSPLAQARRQDFDFLDEAPGVLVRGDAAALGALVRNLADNALRYGPDGSLVRVELRPLGTREVELRVLDEGAGVPPELAGRVFERFFRAESGRGDGAGLGLAIVQRIAELHGGRVGVIARRVTPGDDAPGGFSVILPVAG